MTKETKPKPKSALVAYHDNCLDGFTSCWVTARALQDVGYKVAVIAMKYDKDSTAGLMHSLAKYVFARLVVVDYSLELRVIAAIERVCPKTDVTILDHHKTAFERYVPHIGVEKDTKSYIELNTGKIILDNNESGASLCWKYFNSGKPEPKLITYVRDYDLWRFDKGLETKWVNKYLRTQAQTLARWDEMQVRFEDPNTLSLIFDVGQPLQAKHDEKVNDICTEAFDVDVDGYKGRAVECDYAYVSDVGHKLAHDAGSYGLMYQLDKETKTVKFSIRSVAHYDATVIAALYGGGGHKNAAGFTTNLAEAQSILGRI